MTLLWADWEVFMNHSGCKQWKLWMTVYLVWMQQIRKYAYLRHITSMKIRPCSTIMESMGMLLGHNICSCLAISERNTLIWETLCYTHGTLRQKHCFRVHLRIFVCNQNIGYWHLLHLAASGVVCKALLGVLVMEGLEFLLSFGRDIFSYNQASIVTVCLRIKEHVGVS